MSAIQNRGSICISGGTILAKRTQVTARLTPISMKMYFIATGS